MTPNTRKPKFIKTVRTDWHAISAPPPHPPDDENAHAIFPSTFPQWLNIVSSQKRFIFHESTPMFVGLPTARPSHQCTSSGTADAMSRTRTSMPGICPAPSATRPAIFAVFPLADWNNTRILPICSSFRF